MPYQPLTEDQFNKAINSGYSPIQITQFELQRKHEIETLETPHAKKTFGQKVIGAANAVTDFVGARGIADQFGADIAREDAPQSQKNFVDYPSFKQVAGSAIQTGANLIPGAGVGAGFAAKVGAGLGAGYAFDVGSKLQNGSEAPFTPGLGTVVGGALPVGGAAIRPASAIVGRLMKGLGSGLSGVSYETIEKIINNPQMARQASQKIAKTGNNRVLEENSKTILGGVSKIRQEASAAFKSGLDSLSEVDIKPENLKQGFFESLDRHGISVSPEGKLDFKKADFLDSRIQQRAASLIDTVNKQKDLSGKGVRKLIDVVESNRFKSTPDGDRQAFNAFVDDLSNSLKQGVHKSTDKLGEINKKYSGDMQLAEAVQNIFGKVNFRNLSEVVKASQKLETMFAQKGLAPEVVDKFLTRIGVNPEDFKTTEAVRQISNKSSGANTKGLSVGEIVQQTTSAVVTPSMIRDLSIATGMAKEELIPFLRRLKTPARNAVIQALLLANKDSSEQVPQPQ